VGEKLEHRFAIKRIRKPSDDGYHRALEIYNSTTPIDIKTNTNEITRWLGRSDQSCSFELLLFGLYLGDNIIGMAMLSYIVSVNLASTSQREERM
jgi:hypothetical protein